MVRPKRTKPDRNQAAIIKDLERAGVVVWRVCDIGGKVLDLVCFWKGRCRPVEVKAPGHESDLTDNEAASIAELRRVGVDVIVATSARDVLEDW